MEMIALRGNGEAGKAAAPICSWGEGAGTSPSLALSEPEPRGSAQQGHQPCTTALPQGIPALPARSLAPHCTSGCRPTLEKLQGRDGAQSQL